jgi:hypothetical protein
MEQEKGTIKGIKEKYKNLIERTIAIIIEEEKQKEEKEQLTREEIRVIRYIVNQKIKLKGEKNGKQEQSGKGAKLQSYAKGNV